MPTILGHERQIEYFEKVIKRGQLAHAYLLHGPSNVGKFTTAKAVAKFLCCSETRKGTSRLLKSCGECQSCMNIEKNRHQDVILLDPEHALVSDKEKRKEIPIEDIRELKRIFSLAAVSGHWRVGIINEAEKLSQPAANALLKLLEEPGPNSIFFLITESPQSLLPTIISRTQLVRFYLVSDKILTDHPEFIIKDIGFKKEILSLSFGRPGIMLRLLREPKYLEEERNFYRGFAMACQNGILGILPFTKLAAEAEGRRKKLVGCIFDFFRRALLKKAADNKVVKDDTDRLKKIYLTLSLLESSNVNPRLALDVMMLEALGY